MSERNHIAVIGAGMCGLGAVKALKEEGLEPVCFEKTGHYGGIWYYQDDVVDGTASVMKTTVCNTSKELGASSNFPPPKEFPNYMPHKVMHEYMSMIGKEFDVLRHIKFHQEVISVVPSDGYQETGRWVVSTKDTQSGLTESRVFDGVMVCIGHHGYPNIPTFPGIELFQGRILHTHSLKSNKGFEDQTVLVIGLGGSGADAATDISTVAKKVYVSTRRGSWILPRVGLSGLPNDTFLVRRIMRLLQTTLPYSLVCSTSEWMLNQRFEHSTYNLKPKHRIWSQHPTVSDTLPIRMISGAVVARRGIKTFVNNGVIFEGEEDVTEVDSVILATGYWIKFPFISEDIVRAEDNKVSLYKYMYPANLPHSSLVFIGLIQPSGPLFPLAEMQVRWASRVMSGKCSLPSQNSMMKDIRKKAKKNDKKFVHSPRHTIEVDFIEYIDELATLVGTKPNLFKMAFTDPKLFWACVTGPCLPYQYRLKGPHAWPGARDAILTFKDREIAPFSSPEKYEHFETWKKLRE